MRVITLLAGLLLAGCASVPDAPLLARFVVLGEQGAAVARVLTTAASCPAIVIDGQASAMQVRAAAGTAAPRSPGAHPAAFALLTCEAKLPAGATSATVQGQALPLPVAEVTRFVVLGDTGCRLAAKDAHYQDCNDPNAYPFATIAAAAAAWKPQLVVHMGDYHYREDPCPAGQAGCAGSPWGYGWDAWRADLFTPGQPLLAAAPWVVARGNHELCSRAGQGFWRFIDPRPLQPGRDCNDAALDDEANHSEPYAVPLGNDAQLIVFDSANTAYKGLKAGDPRLAKFAATWRQMDVLSQQARYNIGVDHHAVLGLLAMREADGSIRLAPSDQGLLDAFSPLSPTLLPARMNMMLSGHAHLWEQLSYRSGHASQFIAGFSGTASDLVPLPASMTPGTLLPTGAVVDSFSSWVGDFGYMTFERSGPASWRVQVLDRRGALRNRCTVNGSHSACITTNVTAPLQPDTTQ
ncbi:MAG: metallophosphoesterase [Pseudomonadota bacterium]